MSRAYGRESKNHIKRGGSNDSEIAWTSEKFQKIFQMTLIIIRNSQKIGTKKTPDILGGFLFSYGSVWLSIKSDKE